MKRIAGRTEVLDFLRKNEGEYFWAWSENEHFQTHISQLPEVFYSTFDGALHYHFDSAIHYKEEVPMVLQSWDKPFLWKDVLPLHVELVQRPSVPLSLTRLQWVANVLHKQILAYPNIQPHTLKENCLAMGINLDELPLALANATALADANARSSSF